MSSIAEQLPIQQARVRDLVKTYREIGPAGEPAALMMEHDLALAEKAAASGDVIAILRAYHALLDYKA